MPRHLGQRRHAVPAVADDVHELRVGEEPRQDRQVAHVRRALVTPARLAEAARVRPEDHAQGGAEGARLGDDLLDHPVRVQPQVGEVTAAAAGDPLRQRAASYRDRSGRRSPGAGRRTPARTGSPAGSRSADARAASTAASWFPSAELHRQRSAGRHPCPVQRPLTPSSHRMPAAGTGRRRQPRARIVSAASSAATVAAQPLSSAEPANPARSRAWPMVFDRQHPVRHRLAGRPAPPGSARRSPTGRRSRSGPSRRG